MSIACNAKPYEGEQNYIFFSYCHEDAGIAYPMIERMACRGFRIWYDSGLHPGDDWPEVIAQHLKDCSACIVLMTDHATASHNCKNELNYAVESRKNLVPVLYGGVQLSLGMRLQLSSCHQFRCGPNMDDASMAAIMQAETLQGCKGQPDPSIVPQPFAEAVREEAASGGEDLLRRFQVSGPRREESARAQEPAGAAGARESAAIPAAAPAPAREQPREEREPEIPAAGITPESPRREEAPEPERPAMEAPQPAAREPEPAAEAYKPAAEAYRPEVREPEPAAEAYKPEVRELEPAAEAYKPEVREPEPAAEAYKPEVREPEPAAEIPMQSEEEDYLERTVVDVPSDDDFDEKTITAELDTAPVIVSLADGACMRGRSGSTKLGRGSTSDVRVCRADRTIGREHTCLISAFGKNMVQDMNSVNGTKVDGRKLQPGETVEVGPFAEVSLSHHRFFVAFGPLADELWNAAVLASLRSEQTEESLFLFKGTAELGRSYKWKSGAMISPNIGHKHATLRMEADACTIEDHSRNGTYVNGARIPSNEPFRLSPGDRIRLGSEYFVFNCVALEKR